MMKHCVLLPCRWFFYVPACSCLGRFYVSRGCCCLFCFDTISPTSTCPSTPTFLTHLVYQLLTLQIYHSTRTPTTSYSYSDPLLFVLLLLLLLILALVLLLLLLSLLLLFLPTPTTTPRITVWMCRLWLAWWRSSRENHSISKIIRTIDSRRSSSGRSSSSSGDSSSSSSSRIDIRRRRRKKGRSTCVAVVSSGRWSKHIHYHDHLHFCLVVLSCYSLLPS